MSTQTLAPGSQARIFRNGGDLVSNCLVPDGRFEVRGLVPGQYVARDEQGNERAFEVRVGAEIAVVQGSGPNVAAGASGMPGTGSVVRSPHLNVGREPVFTSPGQVAPGETITEPVPNEAADVEHVPDPPKIVVPRNDPADDVRVPAQPGSALVQDIPVVELRPNVAPAEAEASVVVTAEQERRAREASEARRAAAKKSTPRRSAASKPAAAKSAAGKPAARKPAAKRED